MCVTCVLLESRSCDRRLVCVLMNARGSYLSVCWHSSFITEEVTGWKTIMNACIRIRSKSVNHIEKIIHTKATTINMFLLLKAINNLFNKNISLKNCILLLLLLSMHNYHYYKNYIMSSISIYKASEMAIIIIIILNLFNKHILLVTVLKRGTK